MKKKSETPAPEKPAPESSPAGAGTGAHGGKAQPKGDEHGAKWPGGGKKGEDE